MAQDGPQIRIRCSSDTYADFWAFRQRESFETHEEALNALLNEWYAEANEKPTPATQ